MKQRIGFGSSACVFLLSGIVIASVGCTTRVGDLTIVSTRLVDLDKVDLDTLPTKRRVQGSDMKWNVLLIPIGIPHLEDAIGDALDRGGGDVMTDVTLHYRAWTAILFGQQGYLATGDVVDTRGRTP